MATTRTWTLKIRGDSSDAVRAVDKVDRRFQKLDINKGFGSKLSRLSGRFKAFGSSMAATGRTIAKGMGLAAVGGVALLGTGLVAAFKGAEEHRKVMAKTQQVIKTMGSASWTSAKQVEALSDQLERKTGIDGDIIQNGANVLLTFKNIANQAGRGNDIFDRTVKLSNDMSVALGQDMKSSSIQLGKALNDPIKGITALQRVGVSFTQQQKDQIAAMVESGDLLGAQKLILQELGNQFGGAAEAAASPWSRLRAILLGFVDEVGEKLFPIVERVSTWLADTLPGAVDKAKMVVDAFLAAFREGDVTSNGIVGMAERLGVAVRDAWPHVQNIARAIADFGMKVRDFFKANPAVAFTVLAVVLGGVLLAAIVGVGAALFAVLSPFILVVAAVAAVAGAVAYAYTRWSWFRDAVDLVISWFSVTAIPAIQAFVGMIVAKFQELIGWVRVIWPQVQEAIGHVITAVTVIIRGFVVGVTALWDIFGNTILTLVRTVWDAIWQKVQGTINIVRGVIQLVLALINGDWGRAWEAILTILRGVWQVIHAVISAALAAIRFVISFAWEAIRAAAVFVWGLIGGVVWGAWESIKSSVSNAIQWVSDRISSVMSGISDAWSAVWGGITSVASFVWEGIKNTIRTGANAVIGIINAFIRGVNAVTGLIGIPDIPTIPTLGGGSPAGRDQRSTGQQLASGGFMTNGPQYLVGEGNPAYPEAVIATDPRYRRRNLGLLSWAADKLGVPMGGAPQGFQFGGIMGAVQSVGDFVGGIGDFVRDKGVSAVVGPLRDVAKRAMNHVPIPFMRDLGNGVIDRIYNWLRGKTEEMQAASSGPGGNAGYSGGGVERWRGLALQALRMTGSPASWIGSLLRRMNQESGGNPNAINNWDDNARRGDPTMGLMQNIPSAYRSRVAGFPSLRGTNAFHPLGSIVASIVYTKQRYGSGPAGWDRSGGYKMGGIPMLGFERGGMLPEDVMGMGPSGRRYMMHKGERITSKRAQREGARLEIGTLNINVDGGGSVDDARRKGRAAGKAYLEVLEERRILVDAGVT